MCQPNVLCLPIAIFSSPRPGWCGLIVVRLPGPSKGSTSKIPPHQPVSHRSHHAVPGGLASSFQADAIGRREPPDAMWRRLDYEGHLGMRDLVKRA